ncbi:MAG: hypothetical protein NC231_12410 [Bacillus sp. (in: Bacteria)]|nr:hypothetical protein [Bacillus sp. (in: firmicutes)]MCM1427858.1 hypothetical protein [Eubacterium sp.]
MEFFQKLKEKFGNSSGKKGMTVKGSMIVLAIIIIASIIVFTVMSLDKSKGAEAVTYDYNVAEQQIADAVMEYLALYLELPDEISAQIADAAVQNYNIIIDSNVDIVSDDHTEAIKQRIRIAMLSVLDDETAAALTDDNLDALASGIASIIWNTLLERIEAATMDGNYKEEYLYLSESIQNQINELEERNMKVTIQANIKNNPNAELNAETLLATVDGMTDEELQELAKSLGLSLEELQALLSSTNENLKENIEKDLEKELADLKKEITKEIQVGKNTNNTGRDGRDGKDGKSGENGADGKTTYIAYADDPSGTGFSLTPTETSKYVGTCITDASSQPQSYSSYSNWQIYRTYVITTTTDENGVTTMHIN